MILRSSYYIFRRMLRGYLGFVILLLTPLALISVLGMVAGNAVDEQLGLPIVNGVSATIILGFQLYGGFTTMELIRNDLINSTKWRIYASPYPVSYHGFAILLTCTLVNALQGLIMVIYTQQIFNVEWGNIGFVLLVLLAISALSQLMFLNFVLGVKVYKTAERLGTAYGLVAMLLAGVWFPMPDTGVINFISTYVNPLSIAQNAVLAVMTGGSSNTVFLNLSILVMASVVMVIVALSLGRRKLA